MNDLMPSEIDEMQELLEICEKQEAEIDQLNQCLSLQNSKAQKQISDLLSQITLLKKKVLEQSQEIAELHGHIEKLHNSDLQLKEAQRIRQQAMSEAISFKVRADKDRLEALNQIMKIKQQHPL